MVEIVAGTLDGIYYTNLTSNINIKMISDVNDLV